MFLEKLLHTFIPRREPKLREFAV